MTAFMAPSVLFDDVQRQGEVGPRVVLQQHTLEAAGSFENALGQFGELVAVEVEVLDVGEAGQVSGPKAGQVGFHDGERPADVGEAVVIEGNAAVAGAGHVYEHVLHGAGAAADAGWGAVFPYAGRVSGDEADAGVSGGFERDVVHGDGRRGVAGVDDGDDLAGVRATPDDGLGRPLCLRWLRTGWR